MTPEAIEFLSRHRAEQDAEYEDLFALHKALDLKVSELRKNNPPVKSHKSVRTLHAFRDKEKAKDRTYFMVITRELGAEAGQNMGYWQDRNGVLNILGEGRRRINAYRAAIWNLEIQVSRHRAQEANAVAEAKPEEQEPTEEEPLEKETTDHSVWEEVFQMKANQDVGRGY